MRALLLDKEDLGPDSLDHTVPGTHGAGAAQHCGQNSVGGKPFPLDCGRVWDGRVPCGGDGVDHTLEAPRGDVVKGWWGTSCKGSGTAQGPQPEGLSWLRGVPDLVTFKNLQGPQPALMAEDSPGQKIHHQLRSEGPGKKAP